MKVGVAVGIGKNSRSRTLEIYEAITSNNYKPDFIVLYFPSFKETLHQGSSAWLLRFIMATTIKILPIFLLKVMGGKFLPKNIDTKIYYAKDINSARSLAILSKENADIVIMYKSGFIKKKTCELFHNTLVNAHAGKLPEFRGVSNVEWAYLLDQDLYGTIQFTAPKMDTGDIVYEEKFNKLPNPTSMKEIRKDAFDKVYSLFPKAFDAIQNKNTNPVRQTSVRTTRYLMHPFIKIVLEKRLNT